MPTNIHASDLIYPYFVTDGNRRKETIVSFPGVFRFSIDQLLRDISGIRKLGIDKILLFGTGAVTDDSGITAYAGDGIVVRAIRAIKKEFSGVTVISDVCLCAYTRHGHCGIVKSPRHQATTSHDFIDTKKTVQVLAKIALAHAQAGVDWVAPSACAKGQVGAIRRALDTQGFKKTKILAYSAKFASHFYGPFRNAADSAPSFGNRQSYQLPFDDTKHALARIATDIKEGADMVMVKPALGYGDIIKEASRRFSTPVAAYNVSGEYAMVKAYCKSTVPASPAGRHSPQSIDREKEMVMEILTGIKRAGADRIITYHAKDVAGWLK